MMQYSRAGLYLGYKVKRKRSAEENKKKFDWVNVFLFVLLFVVIILFIFT